MLTWSNPMQNLGNIHWKRFESFALVPSASWFLLSALPPCRYCAVPVMICSVSSSIQWTPHMSSCGVFCEMMFNMCNCYCTVEEFQFHPQLLVFIDQSVSQSVSQWHRSPVGVYFAAKVSAPRLLLSIINRHLTDPAFHLNHCYLG